MAAIWPRSRRWIYIWDAVNFTQSKILDGHADTIRCLAWSPTAPVWRPRVTTRPQNLGCGPRQRSQHLARPRHFRLFRGLESPTANGWLRGVGFSVKIWDPHRHGSLLVDKPGGITQMIYAVAGSDGGRLPARTSKVIFASRCHPAVWVHVPLGPLVRSSLRGVDAHRLGQFPAMHRP